MRVLDATDKNIPSDWTDVEYTALTFTLMGQAELVGTPAWDSFIAANFDEGGIGDRRRNWGEGPRALMAASGCGLLGCCVDALI